MASSAIRAYNFTKYIIYNSGRHEVGEKRLKLITLKRRAVVIVEA